MNGLGRQRVACPGGGVQEGGPFGAEHVALEERPDGAAADGFLGEEVGGAHEQADGHTALGDRGGEGRDHGGGAFVVDAAREEHFEGARVDACAFAVEEVLDHGELRLPQREAVARPDVAAALRALEDEPPGASGDELSEQAGRGHVQEGADAVGFQHRGLGGLGPRR
ncbi:hypothetical protein GCM10020000_73840 [Streptomyces olivoverticillatus]